MLNVTPAERAAITAAAQEAGLGINDYILACTRQTRLVRRSDREDMVQLLAGAEARLDKIARAALDTAAPADMRGGENAHPDPDVEADTPPQAAGMEAEALSENVQDDPDLSPWDDGPEPGW